MKPVTNKRFGQIASVVLLAVLCATLAAADDSHGQSNNPLPPNPVASSQTADADSERVRIGPGDLLTIDVFDVPELHQEIRVSDRGDAVLTLLGSLRLAGMTPAEAQTLVQNLLVQRNYLLAPQVSIVISEYGTQGVSVFGQVATPGVYPVLGTRNLVDVLSAAGGTTPMAAQQATIKRRSGDTLQASLSNQPGELLASNLELQPGDTVIVPKAGIVYVIGDVGRPGGFVMHNSGQITLLQAVAMAAGANHTASQSRTRIIHKTDSGYQDTAVNLKRILDGKAPDVALNAEDIVYIPSSNAKLLLQHQPLTSLAQSAASAAIYVGMAP